MDASILIILYPSRHQTSINMKQIAEISMEFWTKSFFVYNDKGGSKGVSIDFREKCSE